MEEQVWLATRHKDLTRKTRDFLWKGTQSMYKISKYWTPIKDFKQRGICPICNELEDMEHILTSCKVRMRKLTWDLAGDLWTRRSNSPLPCRMGDILGCRLAEFKKNGRPDKGKNRLYHILVSETAYLIWKMRNKRRIRDGDLPVCETPKREICNRWMHALDKHLTIDRALINNTKFSKRAMSEKLVKHTWSGCLNNKEALLSD